MPARLDRAQRDLHRAAAGAALEPGADTNPVRPHRSQIYSLVHAAPPAEAGQLAAVAGQIAEGSEDDGFFFWGHGIESPKLPSPVSGSLIQ